MTEMNPFTSFAVEAEDQADGLFAESRNCDQG